MRARKGRPRSKVHRSPRITVNLPGHLNNVMQRRWKAAHYTGQSEYVLGLMLWDIYSRQPHEHTGPLMREPRWMVSGFVYVLLKELGEPEPPPGDIMPHRFNVCVPETLQPLVEARAREERYRSGSAYATGLVIFDLARPAPHPKKVPHHKCVAILHEPESLRQWAFVHIAQGFGNAKRIWPPDIQSRVDELVRQWQPPTEP